MLIEHKGTHDTLLCVVCDNDKPGHISVDWFDSDLLCTAIRISFSIECKTICIKLKNHKWSGRLPSANNFYRPNHSRSSLSISISKTFRPHKLLNRQKKKKNMIYGPTYQIFQIQLIPIITINIVFAITDGFVQMRAYK